MIPAGVQVFVALEPVDMRYGFARLAGLVQAEFGYEPRGGSLFVFVGKRMETAKVLFWDGSGMCLLHKRLDRGCFRLPERTGAEVSCVEVDEAMLEALLDGVTSTAKPSKRTARKEAPRMH